ncbi:MAG: YkgJ family cysteine cluster protein [Treponema sp.]|jgi:Fe-S-cluster containining protein|nr:YkgJ family cysteine cluster protein [Treponema sp.]
MRKQPFYTAPFYIEGLCFSCTRCSTCCRYERGFVFLTEKDTTLLAAALQVSYTDFVDTYCRWVSMEPGREQLSLKEKPNYDCVFWENGCSLYEKRPLQCRTFPFWESLLASFDAWKRAAGSCPGMGRGMLHGKDEIEAYIIRQRTEPVISRGDGA